jgi:alkylhydroperoxidase family enzyme
MTPVDKQLAPPGGWHPYGAPRIAPFDTKRLSNRRLFRPWLRFAARLMPGGTLERKDSELVILRVGWNCRSRYEWGQHVIIGQREGLTPAEIARVAQGPDAPGWSTRQSALLQAADDLHRERVIAPATWTRLAAHFTDAQLIEVGMLVGHYEMLAGVLNSVGLALEAPAEERLAAAAIHG